VYRPGTANTASKAQNRESITTSSISNINIVNQLIGEEISYQNQAVEIERLKTTCQSLNQKASVAEDLREENLMFRKRISEMEKQSDLQKITIAE
jgi:cell shape-determining protein MreC